MKHAIYILALIGFLYGCMPDRSNTGNLVNDIREDFAKQAEEHNKRIYSWDEKRETLYNRADNDLQQGVKYADSLIENDKSLDDWKKSNLHSIVGELYYDNDSITQALDRFYQHQILTFDSPRNMANKAGCYVKMGDLDKAMTLLERASKTNHDFKWYLGNLYEIKGEIENAISEYAYVYQRDTSVYAYYNQRIQELRSNPEQTMTELYYKDRRKRTLILLEGVSSNDSDRAIGKVKLENR